MSDTPSRLIYMSLEDARKLIPNAMAGLWCYTCNLPGSECDCPIPDREEE